MKSSLPLIALTVLIASSVAGVLSAAPMAEAVSGAAAAAAPAPAVKVANPLFATTAAPNVTAAASPAVPAQPVQLADNDHDDDDDGWFFGLFGHEGGRHGHHGHDDDDDDHDGRACPPGSTNCASGTPAAAGTTAPPANGLFAPGAKPQVQTN